MAFNVLLQELVDYFVVRGRMQVAVDAVLLFVESLASFEQVGVARILSDVDVTLIPVVVSGMLNKHRLEFLLINSPGLHAYFNQHLNHLLQVDSLYHLAISLLFNLSQQQMHQSLLDLTVEDDVRFELTGLHGLLALYLSIQLAR